MEDKSEVLAKIKKILNLSESARTSENSLGEAEAAFELAQRLLKKYHLSMSQVVSFDNSDEGTGSQFFELKEETAVEYRANAVPKWMHHVILAVNLLTDTKCLIKRIARPGDKYFDMKIVYVGDVMDVNMAVELFTFLRTSITKLSTKHMKSVNDSTYKNWRSFAEGCSIKIYERSQENERRISNYLNNNESASNCDLDNFVIDEDDESELEEFDDMDDFKEYQTETSMVQYNKYRDDKFEKIKEFMKNIEAEEEHVSSTTSRIDTDSYDRGLEAGETIQLQVSKKLNGNKTKGQK